MKRSIPVLDNFLTAVLNGRSTVVSRVQPPKGPTLAGRSRWIVQGTDCYFLCIIIYFTHLISCLDSITAVCFRGIEGRTLVVTMDSSQGPMEHAMTHRDKLNKEILLSETSKYEDEGRENKSWSLLAAWGGDESVYTSQAGVSRQQKFFSPRISTLSVESDDDVSIASKSTYAMTRSEHTRKLSSPGAYLRLQSVITPPAPHPLTDLLRTSSSQHQIHMDKVIHSMASLSRAGKERGKRKANQDSCFAFRQFVQPHQAIAGVMDGHGPNGHAVSRYIRKTMPAMIAEQMEKKGEVAIQSVLKSSFIQTHEGLRVATPPINARLSGSTAAVALFQGRRITLSWVGDSRAIIVRQHEDGLCEGIALTKDHKPTDSSELTRILNHGGRVQRLADSSGREIGPYRVWVSGSWVPGLAMSRALGDFVAHGVGVVAEPEIVTHDIHDRDTFLIVASDGVWEFMSVQEVATLVHGCQTAEEACRRIVEEASSRWQAINEGVTDDITVVATKFLTLHT